jgi:hypothetical protein
MTTLRRTDIRAQLYFNCPEKMNHIKRMCKYTNYKDMTVILSTLSEGGLVAKHRIGFGKGWMGKDAGIKGVSYYSGGLKGIRILITVSESTGVTDCWLESSEDRIHLGPPTDIVGNWRPNSASLAELVEGIEEMREAHRGETKEERKMRKLNEWYFYERGKPEELEMYENGEPAETPVRVGMRDVLFGKD